MLQIFTDTVGNKSVSNLFHLYDLLLILMHSKELLHDTP